MNGRQKGGKAERAVAKLFCEWWARAEPRDARGEPIQFVRTPLSGGWGGPQVRAEFRASGDLMTTAMRFPFCVEVKRREGWNLENVAAGARSPVWAWWVQACDAAGEVGLEPVMLFRRNNHDWLCMLRRAYSSKLLPATAPWYPTGPMVDADIHAARFPQVYMADDLWALDPRKLLRRRA